MLGLLLVAAIHFLSLRLCLGQSEGDIRLVGSPNQNSTRNQTGRLDIFWQGRWGTVCELDSSGGDAACRQLGYGRSKAVLHYSTAPEGIPKAGDDMPIALRSYICEFFEVHILRCRYSTDTFDCIHEQDIVLDCSTLDDPNIALKFGWSPTLSLLLEPLRSTSKESGGTHVLTSLIKELLTQRVVSWATPMQRPSAVLRHHQLHEFGCLEPSVALARATAFVFASMSPKLPPRVPTTTTISPSSVRLT